MCEALDSISSTESKEEQPTGITALACPITWQGVPKQLGVQ